MYTNRHEKNEPKIPKALSGAENASFSHDSRLGPFYWRVWWQGITIGVEVAAVGSNFHIGMSLGF